MICSYYWYKIDRIFQSRAQGYSCFLIFQSKSALAGGRGDWGATGNPERTAVDGFYGRPRVEAGRLVLGQCPARSRMIVGGSKRGVSGKSVIFPSAKQVETWKTCNHPIAILNGSLVSGTSLDSTALREGISKAQEAWESDRLVFLGEYVETGHNWVQLVVVVLGPYASKKESLWPCWNPSSKKRVSTSNEIFKLLSSCFLTILLGPKHIISKLYSS